MEIKLEEKLYDTSQEQPLPQQADSFQLLPGNLQLLPESSSRLSWLSPALYNPSLTCMIKEDQPWRIQEDQSRKIQEDQLWRIQEDQVEEKDTRTKPVKNQQHEEDCSTTLKTHRYLNYAYNIFEMIWTFIDNYFLVFSLKWKVSGSVMLTQHFSFTSSNKILSYKIWHYPSEWNLLLRFTFINSNSINARV